MRPLELSIVPPSQKPQQVRTESGTLETVSLQASSADLVSGLGLTQSPTLALTSTILLIRPVPTVVLSVTFPPVGDAVAILTAELKVAGTVWGFGGVFYRGQTHHRSFPCAGVKTALPLGSSPLGPSPLLSQGG